MPELGRERCSDKTTRKHNTTTIHREVDPRLLYTDIDNGTAEHSTSKVYAANEGIIQV
jgi:hypothetical protein